jgi:nicotinate-nucleotide adenylyltransferase
MKHVILFGGAFNPPHIGHLIVIQQAFELIENVDELWLLPDNIGSFGKALASGQHRLAMTQLLIDEVPEAVREKVRVEPLLIKQNLPGETHSYLKVLTAHYPDIEFSFLMGSDNVKSFKRWSRWQDLTKMMHFYVYPRSGHLPHGLYQNMSMLESDTQVITNFSSTIMRTRAEQGLSLQNFIPKKILEYVEANNVYAPVSKL